MKTIDDVAGISVGLAENHDGTFTALTPSQSKTFKTRKGAEKWLAVRGFNADGERIPAWFRVNETV